MPEDGPESRDEHVNRMDDNQLAKIAKNGKPSSPRPPGRPPKRCAKIGHRRRIGTLDKIREKKTFFRF